MGESDGETERGRDFWNWRVYTAAGLFFLLRAPDIVPAPTLAGTLGGVFGGVVGSLLLVGAIKKGFLLFRGWRSSGSPS